MTGLFRWLSNRVKNAVYDYDIASEVYSWYVLGNLGVTTRVTAGRNIYESEWDALIILDALRTDALKSVADEYDFIGEIDEVTSVGSTSKEWLLKTFTEEHAGDIEETMYVTGNGFVHWLEDESVDYLDFSATSKSTIERFDVLNGLLQRDVVSASTFGHIEKLWPLSESNPVAPTPLADAVTDHAIVHGRNLEMDRLVVHYMQPHAPYLPAALERGHATEMEMSPFRALIDEDASEEEIWRLYLDNVRYVLDSVDNLLKNLDADKVVITADHGELFGEWFMYGHAVGFPHPKLKQVPWVETTATDTETLDPDPERPNGADASVEDHLAQLGYTS